MPEVILGQKTQGHWIIGADSTDNAQLFARNTRHHMRKMPVVKPPELDQFFPPAVIIRLRVDPMLLFIFWEFEFRDFLRPDESMVIVGRRVDQMSEDLFLRPLPFRRTDR